MSADEPIAIIGAGCRLPGGVTTPDEFWNLLQDGRDVVGPVPAERWAVSGFPHTGPMAPYASQVRGGFLDRIDLFDAGFFGISGREARVMDPQQRVLLEVAWNTLEHAGATASSMTRGGVFVGISNHDYADIQAGWGDRPLIDSHSPVGGALSIAANRLSHALDWHGPSMAVDTACSSSLVAVHLACRAIRAGECDVALAGGVNIMITPAFTLAMSQAAFLSPTGQCRAFDAAADGYVRSEGAGLVLLKPLDRALADGDRILAVVRGSAVTQDGRTPGISTPSQAAQERAIRDACVAADVDAAAIDYVEAHGPGTQVGDPIEARAIGAIMGAGRAVDRPCLIGSVKTNLGHLESASGIAGLIKLVLALRHGTIPASLHFDRPNPTIAFAALNVKVADRNQHWPGTGVRLAGINSFGFGGTNVHLILSDAPQPATAVPVAAADMAVPLVLSARRPAALRALAQSWSDRLGTATDAECHDLAWSAAIGRSAMDHRLVVQGDGAAALRDRLDRWLAGDNAAGRSANVTGAPARPVFVFCGQGAQFWNMGRGLLESNADFRAVIEECDALLRPIEGWSLLAELSRDEATSRVSETAILQPAVFAIQAGLLAAWRAVGVVPAAVVGHSMGEIAAAYAAGVLTLADALRMIAMRGRIQGGTSGSGRMLAVGLSPAAMTARLADWPDRAWIAGINGPASITVGGDIDAIAGLAESLTPDGIFNRQLAINMACHTPHMERCREALAPGFEAPAHQPPAIPFYSSVQGLVGPRDRLDADYWWANFRQPVDFAGAIGRLIRDGYSHFVEIGPTAVLSVNLEEVGASSGTAVTVLPSLRRGMAEPAVFLDAIGSLYCKGVAIRWAGAFAQPGAAVTIPFYPWQREPYWNESERSRYERRHGERQALLGARIMAAEPCWEQIVDLRRWSWLADHRLEGDAIVPGAAYVAMALAAAGELGAKGPVEISRLRIERALIVGEDEVQTLQFQRSGHDRSFSVTTKDRDDPLGWTTHAAGILGWLPAMAPGRLDIQALAAEADWQPVDISMFYHGVAERGLDLGRRFQAVTQLRRRGDEVIARVELPGSLSNDPASVGVHPVMIDGCLQSVLSLLPAGGALFIPVGIDDAQFAGRLPQKVWVHGRGQPAGADSFKAHFVVTDDEGVIWARIEGLRCRRVAAERVETEPSLVYLTEWVERATAAGSAASPLGTATIGVELPEGPGRTALDQYLDRQHGALEALALGYAFEAAGLSDAVIAPDRRPLHRRLVALAGSVAPSAADTSVLTDPGCAPIADLIRRCGAALPAVLRGEVDPLPLLFPGGDSSDLAFLYGRFVPGRHYLELAVAAIADLVRQSGAARPLNLIEIGAGTGSLTDILLPALPADTRYVATDLSAAFLRGLDRRWSDRAGFETDVLDLEAPPSAAHEGRYDLVVAANVVHATADIRQSLDRLRGLLMPGGVLVLVEIVQPPVFIDTTFGLADGWWRFADRDLRPDHPLLNAAQWVDVLAGQGFTQPTVVADGGNGTAIQSVIVARAPAGKPANILLWADRGGIVAGLADRLTRKGHHCTLVEADQGIEDPLAAGDWDRIINGRPLDLDPDALPGAAAQIEAGCGSVVRIAKSLDGRIQPPALTVLTTAGLAAAHVVPSPAAAAVAGFVRVLGNERSELPVRLIDLPVVLSDRDTEALVEALDGGDTDEIESALRDGNFFDRLLVRVAEDRLAAKPGFGSAPFRFAPGAHGAIDGVAATPLTRREPGPGQVEIEITASGLNFRDVAIILRLLPDEAFEHGFAGQNIGIEFAGRVARTGAGVSGLAVGDLVLGYGAGTLASHVVTDARLVFPCPVSITPDEAATIFTVFVTAAYALEHIARVAPGERVLIHAATGGVGLAALQIAKAAGAELFATAGSEEKRQYLRDLGVAHVYDSRSLAFADEIRADTAGQGVDVVLNSLAGDALLKSLALLRSGGRFLELGKADIYANRPLGLRGLSANIAFFAIDVDPLCLDRPDLIHRVFAGVLDRLNAGALQPLPCRTFAVDAVATALRTLSQAKHIGKLAVSMKPAVPVDADLPAIRDGGSYLITGGFGGFGLRTAEWLIGQGARRIILAGRSGAGADAQGKIAAWRQGGVTVAEARIDIADADQVAALFDEIADGGRLNGIFHYAMVLDDAPVSRLDDGRIAAVMHPKADGAWLLDRHAPPDLDLFVMASSAAATLGMPGQASYAAANTVLSAIAERRRAAGGKALVIEWGWLGQVGYVAEQDERLREHLHASGLRPVAPDEALNHLGRLLALDFGSVAVARVDWPVWARACPALGRSRTVAALVGHRGAAVSAAVATAATPDGRRGALLGAIGGIMGVAADDIATAANLSDIGLDSLMALELKLLLERDFRLDIPAIRLVQGTTTDHLLNLLEVATAEAPGTVVTPTVPVPAMLERTVVTAVEVSSAVTLDVPPTMVDEPWRHRQARVQRTMAWGFRALARIEVEGAERIPQQGPAILAFNHINGLDVPLIFSFCPRLPVTGIGGFQLQRIPVVNWFFATVLRSVFVDRGNADAEALTRSMQVIRSGTLFGIAPEGDFSHTGQLQKGKTGIALLAAETGAPVIPVAVFGHEGYGWRNFVRLRRPTVRIRIGAPLALGSGALRAEAVRRDTTIVMRAIAALLPPAYRGYYADERDDLES